jgi:hypothetical protein
MPERSSWRAVGTKLKHALRSEPEEPPGQAIRDVQASIAARAEEERVRQQQERQRQIAEQAERERRLAADQAQQNQRLAAEQAHQQRMAAQYEREQRIMAEQEQHRRQALEREARDRRNQEAEREQRKLERQQNAGLANIAELRTLIREKYRLDVWIWSQRRIGKVQKANRKIILVECKKADDLMKRIYAVVQGWEEDLFPDKDEWIIAESIKRLLLRKEQHVVWCETPPWDCGEDGSTIARKPVPFVPGRHPAELDTGGPPQYQSSDDSYRSGPSPEPGMPAYERPWRKSP